jgi:hypothetical protein
MARSAKVKLLGWYKAPAWEWAHYYDGYQTLCGRSWHNQPVPVRRTRIKEGRCPKCEEVLQSKQPSGTHPVDLILTYLDGKKGQHTELSERGLI